MGQPSSIATHSRWSSLAVLCAGMLMIVLDGSIVTVAMPAISHDLGFTPASLAWVVDAYLIAFGGLLLLSGRLGDLIGRRRVFLAGLAVFTLASLWCGVATTPELLIAARFVQGAGGALASSVSLGMIVTLFTEAKERATAIGVFSFVGAAGASIGQILGGVLTQALNWHWIFFINLPIGAVAVGFAVRVLARDRGVGLRAGADFPGAALATAGLMLAVYTLVETANHGWTSPHTIGFGAVSVVLLVGFVVRQARAATPLLPLRIFRSRVVSGANAVQALMISAMFAFQIVVALFLENVRGYGAAATGAAMLPAAVTIGGVSLGLSARLIARFGERRILLTGLALLAVALLLLTRISAHGGYVLDLLPTMLLISGGGLAMPALAGLAMSGSTERDAGVVSGLFNTAQQVGAALGVAVLTTLAAGRSGAAQAAGMSTVDALTSGYRLAWTVGAGLLVVAFVLSATLLRGRRVLVEPIAEPTVEPAGESVPVVR